MLLLIILLADRKKSRVRLKVSSFSDATGIWLDQGSPVVEI